MEENFIPRDHGSFPGLVLIRNETVKYSILTSKILYLLFFLGGRGPSKIYYKQR